MGPPRKAAFSLGPQCGAPVLRAPGALAERHKPIFCLQSTDDPRLGAHQCKNIFALRQDPIGVERSGCLSVSRPRGWTTSQINDFLPSAALSLHLSRY